MRERAESVLESTGFAGLGRVPTHQELIDSFNHVWTTRDALARDVVALTEVVAGLSADVTRLEGEARSAQTAETRGQSASHYCLAVDADTGESGWRPCPPSLCCAGDAVGTLHGLRDELVDRRACLVGVKDDLTAILGAGTQDGGLWIRAVAEGRLRLVEQAINNTDAAIRASGGNR